MADKPRGFGASEVAVKEITAKLEQGVKDLFESDKYAAYLQTMSRFHQYSTKNTLLIHMQYPGATRIGGFRFWQDKFNRHVKKGEHGIKIFAPMPFVIKEELAKLDPLTKQPIIGENGEPIMEEYVKVQSARFKIVNVFAYEQTEGEELPELAETLTGDVERYELFMDALRAVSPLPIVFEPMTDKDGYCRFGDRIGIREGMSEVQTVSAVVHELAHSLLHDRSSLAEDEQPKDRRTAEVEAESVSFVVNHRFSVDTGANAWGYIAEWSRTKELKELNASLDIIRKTSAELIDAIDAKYRELAKERGVDLTAVPATAAAETSAEQNYKRLFGVNNNEPPKTDEPKQSEPETPVTPDVLVPYVRNAEVCGPRQIGLTVLMPLLFEDGNLNRDNKRSRVKVEPSIGKYELFSRDEGTSPHQTSYLYTMTACGKLAHLGETARLKDLTEERLDRHIVMLADAFEKQLAAPTEWADFTAAAFLDRIAEAEAHNVPVRELREAERQAEREARVEREKRLAEEKREVYDARVDEIAKAIETGGDISVTYDAGAYDGKNPILELFRLYGVALPLKTQGWVNKRLAAIKGDSYSFYTRNGGKASSAFMDALNKLIKAVKLTPIEQKRGVGAIIPAKTEVKRTLELDNISEQGFMPVKATLRNDGGIDDVDVRIDFSKDGSPIMPEEPTAEETPQIPNIALPDPTVTTAERDAYGYTQEDMYPLKQGKAIELFNDGNTGYLLYPDNTEIMAFDRDEIITFTEDGGLCGITHADWEFSGEVKTETTEMNARENALESELLFGGESGFGIYQVKDGIADARDFRFASLRELETHGLTVDRANYELVYTGNLDIRDTLTNLHKIYEDFNHHQPSDFTGRSVSVSDVIVLQWRGEVSAHYVDSVGFAPLPNFLKEKAAVEKLPQLPEKETSAEQGSTTPQRYSQLGNTLPDADMKPKQPPLSKSKPDFISRLGAYKERAARENARPAQKTNERGGNADERTIHG